MTVDEAKAVHAAYQLPRKDRPPASEYMRYMLAKKVLAAAKLLTLTAGQRGFLEAARFPGESRSRAPLPDQPASASAPPQAARPDDTADEPPSWATEDADLSAADAPDFSATNDVSVEA